MTMKKILYYLLFILINLVIIEMVLSYFDAEKVMVKSYDDKLLFSMYPNRSGIVVSDEYTVRVDTNRFGFRQMLTKNQKYNNFILGDSFTEGWGIPEKDIYVQRLNQSLPAEKRFLNLGIHGSSPLLFALQFPHFINQFQPKHVIIQLFDNDLDDNEKLQRFIIEEEGRVKPKTRLMAVIFGQAIYNTIKESTIYRLMQRIYKAVRKIPAPILYYKPGKEPKIQPLTHKQALKIYGNLKPLGKDIEKKYNNQFGFYKQQDGHWLKLIQKQKELLQKIAKTAQENNIHLQYLYLPAKEFFARGGIIGNIDMITADAYQQKNPHYQIIADVCQQFRLDCLYASDFFFDKNPQSLYFPHDAHLNSKGHKILAEEMIERIIQ